MSHIHQGFYNSSLALLTDMYQMTMSYGYWKKGLDKKEAVFHLFFRREPFNGGFTVASGLEAAINFLENFHFDPQDLAYLESLKGDDEKPLFDPRFFEYLSNLKFSCDVDAVAEGSVVFPYEPLLRIQGPLILCQLLESPLLNLLNFPSLIATKAARICIAAGDEPVLEFGLRRAQGLDGALTASRAAYVGGCNSTSNLLAGKIFGIPVSGTHSHSWIMVFDKELEAFEAYADVLPNSCIFLVDTYNTLDGVRNAIQAGKKLKAQGKKLLGIRLDSGDLADLSIKSRQLLDEAGFFDTKIVASNELDETLISELKRQGSKISVWGVGTSLVTSKEQPALDGVYKLSAIRDDATSPWKYKVKLSEQLAKISNPGILQVRRFSRDGQNLFDVLYNEPFGINKECQIILPFDPTKKQTLHSGLQSKDLLEPIFRQGKKVYNQPSLEAIRKRTKDELNGFPISMKRFLNPHQYVVGMEKTLYDLKIDLMDKARNHSSKASLR